jgi:hypothetical protein
MCGASAYRMDGENIPLRQARLEAYRVIRGGPRATKQRTTSLTRTSGYSLSGRVRASQVETDRATERAARACH